MSLKSWVFGAAFLAGNAEMVSSQPASLPEGPPYFAIRNARLVPVTGPPIENATLVIANGLIQNIGKDVKIPAEAWVIDGTGLTVYPGLIDGLTTLGLGAGDAAPPTGGAPGPAQVLQQIASQPPARGPEDRPATTTWERAADLIKSSDKRIESWRKAGFTSALTVPERGIFTGQAALINLGDGDPRSLVLKTPAALRMNLQASGGFFGFPGSLMGVIAYARQAYLDADHYQQAWTIYDSHPRGLGRPSYDRTLAPLREAVSEKWPILIPGGRSREILRAVRFGEEIGANTLVYGAHQGYSVASDLAGKKLAVLVSLKWPEREKDGDPDDEGSIEELRLRDRAPSTPAALLKSGVKFGFYSDGIGNPKDALKNAKKAVDAGLSAADALRALTLSPAEIYGVADRVGSLDVGKIANVVVADGDLLEEKTKVKMVFVDGRKYEVREPGRPTEPPTVNATGRWTFTVSTPQGSQESTAELSMAEDGTLSGSVTSSRGTASLTGGWVSGNKVSFTLSLSMGPRTAEATYTGTLEGDRMSGTVTLGGMSTDFTATRIPQE